MAAVLPSRGMAQDASGTTVAAPLASSCLASIPSDELVRMMGFIQGEAHVTENQSAAVPADAFAVAAADAFTEAVATQTRRLLGARGDTLPVAEPVVTWHGIASRLIVRAHRDGTVTWRIAAQGGRDSSGAMLLARAVEAVQRGSDHFVWPADSHADSVAFLMRILVPSQDHKGHPQQFEVRAPFPVFSVNVPIEDPVTTKYQARVEYPHVSAAAGISATVIMRFVVDSTGAAVDSTIRDTWPSDRKPLNASDAAAYRTFLTAVRNSIRASRYEPARVGGCAVSQQITQPFVFNLYSR